MDKKQFDLRENLKRDFNDVPLVPRIRKVLDYRYGITDNVPHTLQETGDLYGVTRERIRQMEAKGLEQYKLWKNAKNEASLTNA